MVVFYVLHDNGVTVPLVVVFSVLCDIVDLLKVFL